MTTCASRIPPGSKPSLVPSQTDYPAALQRRCGQRVGIRTFYDASGQERAFCALPGHENDVRAQAAYDDAIRLRQLDTMKRDLRERSRHEWEEDRRA